MADDLDFMEDEGDLDDWEEEGGGGFDPLPDGWYDVRIHSAEVVETKNKKGKMVKLRYDVEGPTHAGRVVFDQMVVLHSESSDAQRIGRGKFARICKSAGFKSKPKDTKLLVGKTLAVKLSTETSEYRGEKRTNNVSKDFKESSGVSSPPDDYDDDDIPF